MTAESFFSELKKLLLSQPKRPAQILNSEDCNYGNYVYYSKNLFNCFDCGSCTDGGYLFDTHSCANCFDCDYCHESELCYECVDASKCFDSNFLEYCNNTTNSWYSYNCNNCHDVFGCINLSSKSFCIFNRQLTEDEYKRRIQHLKTLTPDKIFSVVEGMKQKNPLTQTHEFQNENSPYGNYIYFNKNCYISFDSVRNEFSSYVYDSGDNKFSYDINQSGKCEMSYEIADSGSIFNSDHVVFSKSCIDSSYIFDCLDVRDCIGCAKIEHKQYCILNRQLTKEEYEKIKEPLLKDLKEKNLGWEKLAY